MTISRRRRLLAASRTAAAAALLVLAVAPGAMADSVSFGGDARIVNGLPTQSFPTTGALLHSTSAITDDNAESWCSGTLIGCRTFLTAAHCVRGDTNTSHYQVYLQHGGLYAVSTIRIHPSYNADYSGNDLAVLKLATPVTGIDPTTINTTHDLEAIGVGLGGTIAGFGRSGGAGSGSNDYGIKQVGAIVTGDCDTDETAGESNDKLVCWNYESPIGPAGVDSNTCNGDSGGPLFMTFEGETELVGVTSAGVALNCTAYDHSWDASVYYNRAWIASQIGTDSTATCGGLSTVEAEGATTVALEGSLALLHPSDSFTVEVDGTPASLRFTLNGHDTSFNPDFFVRYGGGASAVLYDCKSDGSAAFGACEFTNPQPGIWSVLVQRASGSGKYQMTATWLEDSCGNGVTDADEECDGADLGTCAVGPCTASCECPAPACGNGVVEAGEDCDGASDDQCPGQCDGSCSCPTTCSEDDLYGLSIVSDESRFTYRAMILDPASQYASLDPAADDFLLEITDGAGSVSIEIPANDPGWIKRDPEHGKYGWKGDGSAGGLRRVKLAYKQSSSGDFWNVSVKGREVPGGGSIDVVNVLDFRLEAGGACLVERW